MKSLIKTLAGSFLGAALLISQSANAVIIEYELTDLGGGDYLYEYSVTNDTFAAGLAGFTVHFGPDEIDESSVTFGVPSGWDPFLFPGTSGLIGAAVDFYALFTTPIPLGATADGFSLGFTWTGGSTGPGDQFFEAYNDAFDFVDGFTVAASTPPPPPGIPEPSTISLLLLTLIGVAFNRKKFR